MMQQPDRTQRRNVTVNSGVTSGRMLREDRRLEMLAALALRVARRINQGKGERE